MKTLELFDTIEVLEAFACYIAYGDAEGLNDRDLDAINSCLDQYPSDAELNIGDESNEFSRCDATDLMGRTIPIEVYCWTETERSEHV